MADARECPLTQAARFFQSTQTHAQFADGRSTPSTINASTGPRVASSFNPNCCSIAVKNGGACASAEEAIEVIPALQPHVVLMDIHLPGESGIACTARLREKMPKIQVIMLTVYKDIETIFEALMAAELDARAPLCFSR